MEYVHTSFLCSEEAIHMYQEFPKTFPQNEIGKVCLRKKMNINENSDNDIRRFISDRFISRQLYVLIYMKSIFIVEEAEKKKQGKILKLNVSLYQIDYNKW